MKKYLKKVVADDCELLFQWTNDELVRENSFSSNIVSFEEHMVWFNNKLLSNNSYMYIFYINENPIGQVRIDIVKEDGIISYSLDKDYRGKGLAFEMLKLAENEIYINNIIIRALIGYVKIDNLASQKIFHNLGYDELLENNNFKYYKSI